jgi:hypothetical protein
MEYFSNELFNTDTSPDLYNDPRFGAAYHAATRAAFNPAKDSSAARDVRYPAFNATLEDARLVTDYRPQCSKNVRPGYQFNTKLWMIRNADYIMDETRKKQMEWSGASLPMANTVPPPAGIVRSTAFYSELEPTYANQGIGIQRADSQAPDLFGTFYYAPTMTEQMMNRKNIAVTTMYEGGRNSRRGV